MFYTHIEETTCSETNADNSRCMRQINYSYNSFYDLCSSEKTYSEPKVMCQNIGIYMGLYMNIPLTDIFANGPPILILYKITGAC